MSCTKNIEALMNLAHCQLAEGPGAVERDGLEAVVALAEDTSGNTGLTIPGDGGSHCLDQLIQANGKIHLVALPQQDQCRCCRRISCEDITPAVVLSLTPMGVSLDGLLNVIMTMMAVEARDRGVAIGVKQEKDRLRALMGI